MAKGDTAKMAAGKKENAKQNKEKLSRSTKAELWTRERMKVYCCSTTDKFISSRKMSPESWTKGKSEAAHVPTP